MASNMKPRNPNASHLTFPQKTIFFMLVFAILVLILHRGPPPSDYTTTILDRPWSGNLRSAQFSWNKLPFTDDRPPPISLKIAVFSRKWPLTSAPGGMERHAFTLYTALARRGHQIHVYTSPPEEQPTTPGSAVPKIHYHEGEPGKWNYRLAWSLYEEENKRDPFDVIHSESVAIPYYRARGVPNFAVTWHGIALESLQSDIYQDLALRKDNKPIPLSVNDSVSEVLPKILNEIRFFNNYRHHIAISDSCGEMLRDVYQIPNKRVHVILNGVNEENFVPDKSLGHAFRANFGIPENARLVLGVAGRLVKGKGHPLLYEAFSSLLTKESGVYLVVAGSGPWERRYRELGPQVIVLGSMKHNELKGFYNAIDIFVNPTLRPQGLDLTLMEAMLSEKPLLTSRFPSIKGSVIVNDEFGFMFSPNVASLVEALEAVVEEGAEKLARRGRACREYAASMFTARKMALAYERLFLCIKNVTFCEYPLPLD